MPRGRGSGSPKDTPYGMWLSACCRTDVPAGVVIRVRRNAHRVLRLQCRAASLYRRSLLRGWGGNRTAPSELVRNDREYVAAFFESTNVARRFNRLLRANAEILRRVMIRRACGSRYKGYLVPTWVSCTATNVSIYHEVEADLAARANRSPRGLDSYSNHMYWLVKSVREGIDSASSVVHAAVGGPVYAQCCGNMSKEPQLTFDSDKQHWIESVIPAPRTHLLRPMWPLYREYLGVSSESLGVAWLSTMHRHDLPGKGRYVPLFRELITNYRSKSVPNALTLFPARYLTRRSYKGVPDLATNVSTDRPVSQSGMDLGNGMGLTLLPEFSGRAMATFYMMAGKIPSLQGTPWCKWHDRDGAYRKFCRLISVFGRKKVGRMFLAAYVPRYHRDARI